MTWDRIAHMNAARARKPASGGRTYKRTISRAPTPARDSWDWLYGTTRAKWDTWAGDAIAQYQFECYGDQWEGL
jgi:hypothetical protein